MPSIPSAATVAANLAARRTSGVAEPPPVALTPRFIKAQQGVINLASKAIEAHFNARTINPYPYNHTTGPIVIARVPGWLRPTALQQELHASGHSVHHRNALFAPLVKLLESKGYDATIGLGTHLGPDDRPVYHYLAVTLRPKDA